MEVESLGGREVEVGAVAFDSKLLEVEVSEVAFGIEVVAEVAERLTSVSIEEALALACGLCSNTVSSETVLPCSKLHFEACTARTGRSKNLQQRGFRHDMATVRFRPTSF